MRLTLWLVVSLFGLFARAWALPLGDLPLVPRFRVGSALQQPASSAVRVGSVTLHLTPLEIPTTTGSPPDHGSPGNTRSDAGSFSATWSRPRERPSSQRLARDDEDSSLSSGSPASPSPRRGAGHSPATTPRNAIFDRQHSPSPSRGPRPWAYLSNGSPQRGPNSPARRYRPLSQSDIFLPVPPARESSSAYAPQGRKKGAWGKLKSVLKGCASCARP